MSAPATWQVTDNLTGNPIRGGLTEDHATALARGLNLAAGPGGRYKADPESDAKGGVTYSELRSMIGEGFHTAFRKGIDSPEAALMWHAIQKMDPLEWAVILEFVTEPIWDLLQERGGVAKGKEAS